MGNFGRLAYRAFYRPMTKLGLADLMRRGVVDSFLCWKGRRALHSWVNRSLSCGPSFGACSVAQDSVIAILGGEKQRDLLFTCLCSVHQNWQNPPNIYLLSDGTMSVELARSLSAVFPGIVMLTDEQQEAALEARFPSQEFPTLRGLRSHYVHIRKMLDVCAQPFERILLLDADTIFHRHPEGLMPHLVRGSASCFLVDSQADSYGYPLEDLQELINSPLRTRINVGLISLEIADIDWRKVERAAERLLAKYGFNFFIEQALWALILSERDAVALPADDFVCSPSRVQSRLKTAVFHHYVWPSRYLFYAYGWQHLARHRG